MEEVEQICSRIAIMDKGRTLATGNKEELKAMIPTGETITIRILNLLDHHQMCIRDRLHTMQ